MLCICKQRHTARVFGSILSPLPPPPGVVVGFPICLLVCFVYTVLFSPDIATVAVNSLGCEYLSRGLFSTGAWIRYMKT